MGSCNVVATGHGRYSSVLYAETVSSTGSVASSPGHSQILSRSRGCEIKSGSGLGKRLLDLMIRWKF